WTRASRRRGGCDFNQRELRKRRQRTRCSSSERHVHDRLDRREWWENERNWGGPFLRSEPEYAAHSGNAHHDRPYPLRTGRSPSCSRQIPASLIVESKYPIQPLDFDGISTYPIESRKSKVHAGMFGKPMDGSENVLGFVSKLPHIL